MGYSREFLIDAFLWRYTESLLGKTKDELDKFVEMILNYYLEVGKDKFRESCSLDSAKIKEFRLATGC